MRFRGGVLFMLTAICLVAFEPASAQDPVDVRQWHVTGTSGKQQTVDGRAVAIAQGKLKIESDAGQAYVANLKDLPEEELKEALIRVIGSGVVVIRTKDVLDEDAGVGSGFVFRRDGMILTNYHVVRGAGSIEVEFRGGGSPVTAYCLAVDRNNDVAILKVDELPPGAHVLELSVKERPKQGDSVWTIGHPERLTNTVSWGDVNAVRKATQLPDDLRKALDVPDDTFWIQTDAVISHGSSGGPLLNPHGQVIGMNTFIAGPQLGFALHVVHARGAFQEARNAEPLALPLPPGEGESALAYSSREIAPILKDFREKMQQLQVETRGLPQEQSMARARETFGQLRTQLMEIVERDPAGWPAFQALSYVCNLDDDSEDSRECRADVCRVILEHHANSQDLAVILPSLAAKGDDDTYELCRTILEENPHDEVKAQANAAIAANRLAWMASGGSLDLEQIRAARDMVQSSIGTLKSDFADADVYGVTGEEVAAQIEAQLNAARLGLPAAEIRGVDTDGKTFKLSEYKGKVVLLDFFADWCPWCRKMYPHERDLMAKLKGRPFVLLGVNTDNQRKLTDLVDRKVVTWRCWADGEGGPIATDWQITGYPSIYLIDHNGIVRRHFSGTPGEKALDEAVDTLLSEAEK